MARSVQTDPYHDFRFHLVDTTESQLSPVAGFTTVTMPNVALEEAPYREGTMRWTQKYPGIPTVGDVTLQKGIFRADSDFYNWVLRIVNGGESYRTELALNEFHIADEGGINGSPSRVTTMRECWGKDAKPTGDKDASSSNVALESLTISVEELEVKIIST